jgi:hypothetical protein
MRESPTQEIAGESLVEVILVSAAVSIVTSLFESTTSGELATMFVGAENRIITPEPRPDT